MLGWFVFVFGLASIERGGTIEFKCDGIAVPSIEGMKKELTLARIHIMIIDLECVAFKGSKYANELTNISFGIDYYDYYYSFYCHSCGVASKTDVPKSNNNNNNAHLSLYFTLAHTPFISKSSQFHELNVSIHHICCVHATHITHTVWLSVNPCALNFKMWHEQHSLSRYYSSVNRVLWPQLIN